MASPFAERRWGSTSSPLRGPMTALAKTSVGSWVVRRSAGVDRRVLHALDPDIATHPAVVASGGLDPFAIGLYGCSEMINEGFKRLVEVGVIRRRVVDKAALMRRANAGTTSALDGELIERDGGR